MLASSILLPLSDAFRGSDQPRQHPICFRVEAVVIGELNDLAVERADIGATANMKIVQHRRPMTNCRRKQLIVKDFSIVSRAREGDGDAECACERESLI